MVYVSSPKAGDWANDPLGRMRDNGITAFFRKAGIPPTSLEGDQKLTLAEVREAYDKNPTNEARILLACFSDYATVTPGGQYFDADKMAAFLHDTNNGTRLLGNPRINRFLASLGITNIPADRGLLASDIPQSEANTPAGRLAKYFNYYAIKRDGDRYMTIKDIAYFMKTTSNGTSEPDPIIQQYFAQGLDRGESALQGGG